MPAPQSTGPNSQVKQVSNWNALYLPNSGRNIYFSDAPRVMSADDANALRAVADRFGISLQGIMPGSPEFTSPYEAPGSRVSYSQFESMSTKYVPGVGRIVGSNAQLLRDARIRSQPQRGYYDPNLGWIPIDTDPNTGQPYEAPQEGAVPTSGPVGPAPGVTATGSSDLPALGPDGQVLSPSEKIAQIRYDTAFAKAREDILLERDRRGITTPLTAVETDAVNIEAKRRAIAASNAYIGGDDSNAPMINPLGPDAVMEFKPGQILPQLTGFENVRRLTDEEVQNLNFLKSGMLDGSEEAYAQLLDPMVPFEMKQPVLEQLTGIRQQIDAEAQTAQEQTGLAALLTSGWNPYTWIPRLLISGIELIAPLYEDYVDPSLTWTISALPGGPRTASWQEAQSIAPGQMYTQTLGKYATVGNPLAKVGVGYETGGWLGAGASLISQIANPFSAITDPVSAMLSGRNVDEAIVFSGTGVELPPGTNLSQVAPWISGDPNRIYDSAYRQSAFVDNKIGSGISGGTGLATMMVWDPLVFAGPAAKFVRVSHRLGMGAGMLRGTEKDLARFRTQLDLGQIKYQGYDEARKALDEARLTGDADIIARAEATLAEARTIKNKSVRGFGSGANALTRFGDWIIDSGGKPRTVTEILRHSVMRGVPNAAEVAESLNKVRTFEEFALVMRSQAGDAQAVGLLRTRNAELAAEIEYLQLTRSADNAVSAPADFSKAKQAARVRTTNAISEFTRLRRAVSNPSPMPELEVGAQANRVAEALDAARAADELGVDAVARQRLWEEVDKANDILEDMIFGRTYDSWDEATRNAWRNTFDALEREKMLDYASIGRSVIDDAEKARIDEALNQLKRRNAVAEMALKSEAGLLGNRVNFGLGRWRGGANWREAARQARAERQAFQAATHGSGFKWIRQQFDVGRAASADGKITVWGAVGSARRIAADALTRPFTYAAMESPSGWIQLKGINANQSYREVLAVLDNLRFYGQDAGLQGLKQGVLERFIRNMNNPNRDGMDTVRRLEKSIVKDMLNYYGRLHGINEKELAKIREEISDLYALYDGRRVELIRSIEKNGYWKDEAGNLHSSPVIDSQLIDGMPMIDFLRLERIVSNLMSDVGKYGTRRTGTGERVPGRVRSQQQAVIRAQGRLDQAETDLALAEKALDDLTVQPWTVEGARKAAAEGNEEAIQYLANLALAKKGRKKTKARVKELDDAYRRALADRDREFAKPGMLSNLKEGGLNIYDEFQTLWRAQVLLRVGYPVRNSIDGVSRRLAFEASLMPLIEDAFTGVKNAALNVIEGRNVPLPGGKVRDAVKDRSASSALAKMEKTGKAPRRVTRWARQERQRLTAFRDNQRKVGDESIRALSRLRALRSEVAPHELRQFDAQLYSIEQNVRTLNASVADLNKKIAALETDSPSALIAAYRRSLDRPRRVGQEMVQGVDGRTYWGARSDPQFADILEASATAGETVQATLGLNMSISRSVMKASEFASGGSVSIGNANYMPSLTRILNNQIRNSLPGRMWLSGASVKEVAAALMDPAAGARYRNMINNDSGKAAKATAADEASSAAYDAKARRAVLDEIEYELGINPRDIGRLETDADRAKSLIGAIEVPGYGRLDTLVELEDVAGRRSLRLTIKDPAVAPAGSYAPTAGGWRYVTWEVAPEGEMNIAKRYPRSDVTPSPSPEDGRLPRRTATLGGEDIPRVILKRSEVQESEGRLMYLDEDGVPRDTYIYSRDVLSKDDIPDVVYHVTVNDPGIERDGIIRVSNSTPDAAGGLGGNELALSVTADFDRAQQIARDLQFDLALRQLAMSGQMNGRNIRKLIADEFWAEARYYKEVHGNYPRLKKDLKAALDRALSHLDEAGVKGESLVERTGQAMNQYLNIRQTLFEVENPIITNRRYMDLRDPGDVYIYTISKNDIPDEALLVDNGFRKKGGENAEIQIHADIPVGTAKIYVPPVSARVGVWEPPLPAPQPAREAAASLVAGRPNPELVQSVANAVREQGLGMRVSVLKDGRGVSIGLPQVTEGLRQEAIERVQRLAREAEQARENILEGFDGGLEMIHSLNRIENYDDALLHAQWLFNEFERYVPSEELRTLLASGTVRQRQVEQLLSSPEMNMRLPDEIHGAEVAAATGASRGMAAAFAWTNNLIGKGFRKLGTLPEDRVVRFPFMARRYKDTLRDATRVLADQFPDGEVPGWAVDWAIQAARKRAVKDTNDYFYTQPRRTNFGKTFERFIPFIAAWQNTGMAMSKLIATNPETLVFFEKAWLAPDRIGMTDENGNLRIPIPSALIGKTVYVPGVGDVPITGVYGDEWVYDKKSVYVLPQQFDPILTFKASPVFGMSTSMIFAAGYLGPTPPSLMKSVLDPILGDGASQKLWDYALVGALGVDDFGRDEGQIRAAKFSDRALAYDQFLSPALQKWATVFTAQFGPENDRTYAAVYANVMRDEMLKWLRGEREEPTKDDIISRTNGLFTIRGLTNLIGISGGPLGAVTPPQADFDSQQLVELYRDIQDMYGFDKADEVFMSLFGDEVTFAVKTTSSKGIAPATVKSLDRIEKYGDIVEGLSLDEQDQGLLRFALSDGTETQDDYNPNVRMAQFNRNIPGSSNTIRENLSPDESSKMSLVNMGWTTYIQLRSSLQAELDARGLKSFESAPELKAELDRWVARAQTDPVYRYWYEEKNDGFENNFLAATKFMRGFTQNEQFMSDPKAGGNQSDMWIAAEEWLSERDQYMESFALAGDNTVARRVVRDRWAEKSTEIARSNIRFYDFWLRYLEQDDLELE